MRASHATYTEIKSSARGGGCSQQTSGVDIPRPPSCTRSHPRWTAFPTALPTVGRRELGRCHRRHATDGDTTSQCHGYRHGHWHGYRGRGGHGRRQGKGLVCRVGYQRYAARRCLVRYVVTRRRVWESTGLCHTAATSRLVVAHRARRGQLLIYTGGEKALREQTTGWGTAIAEEEGVGKQCALHRTQSSRGGDVLDPPSLLVPSVALARVSTRRVGTMGENFSLHAGGKTAAPAVHKKNSQKRDDTSIR